MVSITYLIVSTCPIAVCFRWLWLSRRHQHLGFEAQRFLASRLSEDYDPMPILKMTWSFSIPGFSQDRLTTSQAGDGCVVFLTGSSWHLNHIPLTVFIDGPMPELDLRRILPEPEAAIGAQWPGGTLYFNPPATPIQVACLEPLPAASLDATTSLARR